MKKLSKSKLPVFKSIDCTGCKLPRKIYAKSLCSNCYYKNNLMRLATECKHAGLKPHYSKGQCRNCYLMDYYTLRKDKRSAKKNSTAADVCEDH